MATIDLSSLKDTKADEAADWASLNPDEREALAKMAEDNPLPAHRVKTAFLVLVEEDGAVTVQPDLAYEVVREDIPNTAQIFAAVTNIAKDIQVQETAQYTAIAMQQMAMQAQQQMQAARLAQGLNLKH